MTQSSSADAPRPNRPTWKSFVVVLGIAMAIGYLGIFQLRAIQEANTTHKEGGAYVPGDCRVFQRTLPGTSFDKVQMARMCLHKDGKWVVEESTTKRVPVN